MLSRLQHLFHAPIARDRHPLPWPQIITLGLALWIGGSLVLDFVVMPSLMEAGMMDSPAFAAAGLVTFERFNHLELLVAAATLTGILALSKDNGSVGAVSRRAQLLAGVLLAIAAVYTYILTPQMSALGMDLSFLEPHTELPAGMTLMHVGYWSLEAAKLTIAAWLLRLCDREFVRSDSVV